MEVNITSQSLEAFQKIRYASKYAAGNVSENRLPAYIPDRLKLSSGKYTHNETSLLHSVDNYLNLSHRNTYELFKVFTSPESGNKTQILSTISKLAKRGIIGYEYLDLNNKPYKSFISTGLVQPYSNLKTYRKNLNTSSGFERLI